MKPTAFSRLVRTGSPAACLLATAIATLLALVTGAQAATTSTFTPTTAGTYAWTTGGNWSGSGVPVSATDATVAFFPDVTTALTGAVTINTDPATLTLNTLTLNGLTAATAAANSIGTAGNTWTFDGTTPTLNLNGKSGATSLSYTLKPNLTLNQNLTFAGIGLNGGLTISGVISGLNTGITNNSKPSTITLNGSVVNTFTGGVTLYGGMVGAAGGTLALPGALAEDFTNLAASPNNNLIDSGNVLTLAGGRISLVNKYNTASSQTFASTTLSANTCSVVTLAVVGSGSMTVALQAITRNPGSTLVFSTAPNASTLFAPTAIANEASGILGPWAFAGNASYACNNGSGQIIAYTGATAATLADLSNVTSSTTNYAYTNASTGSSTLTGNITGNTLLLATPVYTLNNSGNTITLNGIISAGSGAGNTKTISGSGSLVIGANKELVINVFRPLTISCPIVDWNGTGAGASRLTYSSAQASDGGYALKFTGTTANTYSGLTSVAGGSLTLGKTAGVNAIAGDVIVSSGGLICAANEQIADTANLTISGTGQFDLGGKTETINNVTILGNATKFANGSGWNFTINGTLSISNNNGAPSANFTEPTGSGAQTWTVGAMNFDNSFFGITSGNTQNAAFNLKGDFTGANSNTLTATATSTGTARFILNGTGTHNHNFNITSGTTTINGPIYQINTASLTKTGAGTLSLTGTNTYSGDTTVSGGILAVNGSSIKDTNKLIINGGQVQPTGTEMVDTLFFGATQQATGTWGATGSGATHIDNTHFSGTAGVVSVANGPAGVSAYDTWATTTHGLSGGDAAFDFDDDKDGIANGLEWILGGDPKVNDTSSILPTTTADATNGLTLVFNRASASIAETTLTVEWNTDLSATWNSIPIGTVDVGPSGSNPTVDIDAPVAGKVTVNIPAANAAPGAKIFARIKATQP